MVEKKGGPVPRQKFNLPSPRPQPSTPAAPARYPQTWFRRSSLAFDQPGAPAQHPGGPSPVPPNAAPKVQPGTRAGPLRFLTFASSARYQKVSVLFRKMRFLRVQPGTPAKVQIAQARNPGETSTDPGGPGVPARRPREPSPACRRFLRTRPRTPARYHRAGPAPPRAQPGILATFADPARYPGPVPQD